MSFIDGAIKPKLVEQKVFDKVMKVQEETKPFKLNLNICCYLEFQKEEEELHNHYHS